MFVISVAAFSTQFFGSLVLLLLCQRSKPVLLLFDLPVIANQLPAAPSFLFQCVVVACISRHSSPWTHWYSAWQITAQPSLPKGGLRC